MMSFHESIMAYVYGSRSVTPALRSTAPLVTALLGVDCRLCGCDFVELRGLRADLVLLCAREVARNRPDLLELMHGAYTGGADETRAAGEAIKAVVEDFLTSIAGAPRMKATSEKASTYSDPLVLRACWIAAYWNGNEFKNVHNWGSHASNDNQPSRPRSRRPSGRPKGRRSWTSPPTTRNTLVRVRCFVYASRGRRRLRVLPVGRVARRPETADMRLLIPR